MEFAHCLLLISTLLYTSSSAFGQEEPDGTPLSLQYSFVSEGGTVSKLQGEDAEFVCEVDGVQDWQTVSWLNGTQILFFGRAPGGRDSRISLGGTGNTYILSITDLDVRDESTYICSLAGDHPIQQEFQLVVNIPPSITMVPDERRMDLLLGDSLEVACNVAGKPTPVVTWTREDSATIFANDEDHFNGEVLSFPKVEKHHTGTYQCLASNGYGGDKVEDITINVMYPPTVQIDTDIVHTGPGETPIISCNFDGNPKVQVMWQHDGSDINFQERDNLETSDDKGEASLIINNLKAEDLGEYTCSGGNEKGDVQATITLSALPYGLQILSEEESLYSDSYTLEWQVGSVPQLIECDLMLYEMNKTGEEHFQGNNTIPIQLDDMIHSYTFTELHANGSYVVYITCHNSFGSTETDEMEFYTSTQHRPAPPPTTPSPVIEVEQTEDMMEKEVQRELETEQTVAQTTAESEKHTVQDTKAKENPTGGATSITMVVSNVIIMVTTATWWSQHS